MKLLNIFEKYMDSYKCKIRLIAFLSTFIGLALTVIVSYYGVQTLFRDSSREMEKGINGVTKEYVDNYIDITGEMVEEKIQRLFDEQAMITDMYQRFIDNADEFSPIVKKFNDIPYLNDKLSFNGRWYQNANDEVSVVLIQRYLLDDNNRIRPEVAEQVNQSAILDIITPSVYKYGAKKLWIYFQGGKNASFMRITPWNDAGTALDLIYPKHTDEENWEAFNPGLVDSWKSSIINNSEVRRDLASLAIVKSPTQDGGSGKIIMTFDYPVWSKDRTAFKGAICIDVELDEIISYIENVKLARTGFAFVSQSNGNVFAINERGAKTLGLKSIEDSTIRGSTGIGFNPMLRFLSDSKYDSVHKIELPKGQNIYSNEIQIEGKTYILVKKKLKPMNSWHKDKGFYKENWTLGFVVPKGEIYSTYIDAQNHIRKSRAHIMLEQIMIAIVTILIIWFGIHIVTDEMTKNLERLEAAAYEIMNKNYDVTVAVESNDEIGKLGMTINNMVCEIKDTFEQLTVQNEALKNEIAERQDRERQIRYLEDYDAMTGLPKQKQLLDIAAEGGVGSEAICKRIAIIIGIDNFRSINEVFGHAGGNEVLKQMAERLKTLTSNGGSIGRLDGDEFGLIFDNINSMKEAAQKVENIMSTIKHSYKINGKELFLTICAGISFYPDDSDNYSKLIQYAISALIHAKKKGPGSYQFYDAEMNKAAENRINMISGLRNAVKNNELEVYYQPIFDLPEEKCIGVEALVRWHSHELGEVEPSVFIPLAEESGIINDMGKWVMRTAVAQTKKWHDMGYKGLSVAVNLSAEQFNQENLAEDICDIIDSAELQPEFLELEVTESLFINDINNAVNKLNKLRNRGVRIVVDDFGTGYSSLSYLRELPIDKLKIDRSFIKDIPCSDNGSIAAIIIGLAKSFNMKVNAEGVEISEQVEFLKKNICNEVQGYYYSKPITADALTNKFSDMFEENIEVCKRIEK